MEKPDFLELLNDNPIVAAVKSDEGLDCCLRSGSNIVFVLYGSIMSIAGTVLQIKNTGKIALVHVDLIDGLAQKDVAIDYIAGNTAADGIISTKPNLIKYAGSCGLLTVQRFFVLDSISLLNLKKQLSLKTADMIEILPGIMPRIIRDVANSTETPVIAGGLISEKEDIVSALSAGAVAISSTKSDVWFM